VLAEVLEQDALPLVGADLVVQVADVQDGRVFARCGAATAAAAVQQRAAVDRAASGTRRHGWVITKSLKGKIPLKIF